VVIPSRPCQVAAATIVNTVQIRRTTTGGARYRLTSRG